MNRTAFVLGTHYNGLHIAQMLGRRKVRVIALDTHRSIGTYSRYVSFIKCPDPHWENDRFIEFLVNIGKKRNDRPILFPTGDGWAASLSNNFEKLIPYYELCVAEKDVVNLVLKKSLFYKWAELKGYPVPKVYDIADDENLSTKFNFPIIAKPDIRRKSSADPASRQLHIVMDKLRFTHIKDDESFESFCLRNENMLEHLLFQESVEGNSDAMFTIGIYADKHSNIRVLFTGHKVRGYPFDHGDCSVGESFLLPKDLIDMSHDLVRDLKYKGIAELEFKKDIRTGQYKLIEINPRSWSWIGIVDKCNAPIPIIAYSDLSGETIPEFIQSDKKNGEVKYVKILQDLVNCTVDNRNDENCPFRYTPLSWYKNLKSSKLITAEFAIDDPIPGVVSLYKFTSDSIQRFGKKKYKIFSTDQSKNREWKSKCIQKI